MTVGCILKLKKYRDIKESGRDGVIYAWRNDYKDNVRRMSERKNCKPKCQGPLTGKRQSCRITRSLSDFCEQKISDLFSNAAQPEIF